MKKLINIVTSIFVFIFFSSQVLANQNLNDECLKNADIGNYIGNENFDGIKSKDIKVNIAKEVCLLAMKKKSSSVKILRSLGRIFNKAKNYKKAFEFFQRASEIGDGFSDWMISEAYYYGNGVKKDYSKAFHYISKSKDKKFIWALENIGSYYQFGHGTKIDLDKSFSAFNKCAEKKLELCLNKMRWAYKNSELNATKNKEKELYYIKKLIEIDSNDGFTSLGEYLLTNATNEIDIRNALLNLEKAGEDAHSELLNLYLFPEDYPIFNKMFPNKKLNKQKGIKILNSMVNNTNYKNYDVTLGLIGSYFRRPYYTQAFKNKDFKNVFGQLEKIHINFNSNHEQIESKLMSNLASKALGEYYFHGLYSPKNLIKSINYFSTAADRGDFDAAISAGWAAYQNYEYKKALKYNNFVIKEAKEPEYVLYALNNSAVVDAKINGNGTKFQLDNYKKAAEIVDKYEYFVEWPYDNLTNLFYFPTNNLKKENSQIQNIEKAKFYHNKYLNLLKKKGQVDTEENDYLSFLMSKFSDPPQDLLQTTQYLEYAAVNGYTYAYFQLAWIYSGYKDKDYKNEIYKWFYICTVLSDEETQNTCRNYIKEWKDKINYYDKKEIEQSAADWIYSIEDRLTDLNKKLNLEEKVINYAGDLKFGNYHALLIGINKYDHFQNLKTPINDVNRLEKILKEKYKFSTKKLINPSRRDLLKQINNYTKSLSKNDNLIIYYAGHGMQKSNEGFWLTREAEKDNDIDWISNDTIVRKLREIKANNILIVADSCFSGLLTKGLNLKNKKQTQTPIEVLHEAKSRIAITSGGNEPVLDGGGGENSIFAASLASELENRSNAFTASDLFSNIKEKVMKETLAFGIKQNPIILDIPKSGHENFDFVFIPN